jgi:hypothetical protein
MTIKALAGKKRVDRQSRGQISTNNSRGGTPKTVPRVLLMRCKLHKSLLMSMIVRNYSWSPKHCKVTEYSTH